MRLQEHNLTIAKSFFQPSATEGWLNGKPEKAAPDDLRKKLSHSLFILVDKTSGSECSPGTSLKKNGPNSVYIYEFL
ncbi:hypothetical protein R1flu_014765 [Riccia fluitans]|uniref:Uncharacterized protein n=1 Tax=Riccia fluitans TaxID=41844 RepID=A0ABD1YH18_9MARC